MRASLSENIETLMHQFPFDALSAENKALVLGEMTAEEYMSYREISLEARNLAYSTQQSLSSTQLKNMKRGIYANINKEKSLLQKMLYLQLPIWAIILLGAVCFLAYWLPQKYDTAQSKSIQEIVKYDTVFVQHYDTIYKEIKVEPKVIYKEVIKLVEVEKGVETSKDRTILEDSKSPIVNNQESSIDKSNIFNNVDLEQLPKVKRGKNILQEEALMDLLVQNQRWTSF